jgi:DNA-binding CsgD family transcriptional regulator
VEICRGVQALPPQDPPRPRDLLLSGYAQLIIDGYAAATPMLQRAALALTDMPVEDVSRWGWMAVGTHNALWDNDGWYAVAARNLQVVRDAGELAALPSHLTYLAMATAWTGDFAEAESLIAEIDSVTGATSSPVQPYAELRLRALQGREDEVSAAIRRFGPGEPGVRTRWAIAVLNNGLARYPQAVSAARVAVSETALNHWVFVWLLPELIEAAVRTGDVGLARAAHARLAQATQPYEGDFPLGMAARCRALLSEGDAADGLYREAIERLSRTRLRPEVARARLLYGEWLRRENRRADAREQLHAAYEMLAAIGMGAFAERARVELAAVGEHVRKRAVGTPDHLTPQERQIARLARDGSSNPEIGSRLFLSPRTVEWHLRNVFTKLSIRSRRELASALAGPDAGRDPGVSPP